MNQRVRVLTGIVSVALLAALSTDAAASVRHKPAQRANAAAKTTAVRSPAVKSTAVKSTAAKSAAAKSVTTKSLASKPGANKSAANKSLANRSVAGKAAANMSATKSVPIPKPRPEIEASAPAAAPPQPQLSGDPALVKQALDLVRKGRSSEASALKASIGDPAARTLVEWLILWWMYRRKIFLRV